MATARTRAPLNRDDIVIAASELISSVGLDGLTLRRLADVFHVSAPALYAHFTDKNELLRAVAAREFDDLMADYRRIDEELGPDDPLSRIRSQAHTYVRRSRNDPELFRVMFLFPPDLGGLASMPEGTELPAATQAFNMALDTVAQAIEQGAIEADDPLLVALTMWAGAHGIANVLLLGPNLPAEFEDALIDEVIDRTLRGYGARASESA